MKEWTREIIEDISDELLEVGLSKAADIVMEFAANSPSQADLRFCPYPQTPENALNIKCWLRSEQQRLRERERKRNAVNDSPVG